MRDSRAYSLGLGTIVASVILCAPTVFAIEDKPVAVAVEIKEIDHPGLKEQVTKWKGKPVVMDVWATWCVPCKEKFPKYVKLAKSMKDKASFISMSIDDGDSLDKVREFLKEHKAEFKNFRMKTDPDEFLSSYGFDGVPLYVVWDTEGKIALKTDDLTKVESKLTELTAEKPSK